MAADAADTAAPAGVTLSEELKNSLDKVDLLIADLGQVGDFTSKATEFADQAAKELFWNKIFRGVSVAVTLAVMFTLLTFLHSALATDHFSTAFQDNPYALAVLIGGAIGGVVVLAIALTRAVHSTFAERNAGMPLPEHLKTVVDTVKTILPKN